MPRPIPLKQVLKVLQREGFFFIKQKESHAKYRKLGKVTQNVTIKTTRKEIPHGTFRSILLQSGLKESDFIKGKK